MQEIRNRLSGWTPVFSIMPLALLCLVASLIGPAGSQIGVKQGNGVDTPKGPKFKIPGSYTASSANCVWNITNTATTSNGGALCGTDNSTDSTGSGVQGIGISGPGVVGTSTSGEGVLGFSTNTIGVVGTSTNGEGVYGATSNNNSYAGYFDGNVIASNYLTFSDVRYKSDITTLPNALDKVLALRGVSFDWRQKEFPDMHFGKDHQIGFVAQEVEKVLPEIVSKDKKGYRGVNYTAVVPVLVEAIKDQQKTITDQQKSIEVLQKEIDDLKAALAHR